MRNRRHYAQIIVCRADSIYHAGTVRRTFAINTVAKGVKLIYVIKCGWVSVNCQFRVHVHRSVDVDEPVLQSKLPGDFLTRDLYLNHTHYTRTMFENAGNNVPVRGGRASVKLTLAGPM